MDSVALVWNYVVMHTFSALYADGQEGKGSTETVIYKQLDLNFGGYLFPLNYKKKKFKMCCVLLPSQFI